MALGRWINPFRVNRLEFRPLEEGTETTGEPEEVFERGDWVTLGFIEPAAPMSWGQFVNELDRKEGTILERAFHTIREKLERLGYEVERSREPLFHAEPRWKPRVWYVVKRRGEPIAYCDLAISEPEYGAEKPFAELTTVCMRVSKKPE